MAVDLDGVDGQTLRFRKACIATGARAAAPPIPGLAEAGYLTNETVFSLTKLPCRIAVLGAGPIGCELSQTLRRFGAEVILLDRGPHILPREDEEAARLVEQAIVRDGARLLTKAMIKRVERRGGEKVLTLDQSGKPAELVVGYCLGGSLPAMGTQTGRVQTQLACGTSHRTLHTIEFPLRLGVTTLSLLPLYD